MANLAKFTINATPSSPGGFDATISQVLTFALEGGPANLVQRWTLQVFDALDAESPLASKNAPSLTLVGATSGQKVDSATPGSSITSTMPGSGVHSWLVRSLINGGLDASGKANPDYVFERLVCIKTGSGLRKIVGTEATQYGPRGWADAQNDLIDAGAGPLTAPGGAGDANKVAAASGAGTNLQYAAGIFLGNSGLRFELAATSAAAGIIMQNSTAATDTARREVFIQGQLATGNTSTMGGSVKVAAGAASGAGGTHLGGWLSLEGGSAPGASGTRNGGDVSIFGGTGGTRYGNVFIGTDYNPATWNWQGMGRGIAVQDAQAEPTADASSAFFHWANGGRPKWRFNGMTLRLDGLATTASAGAQTLPGNPQGFLTVQIDGTTRKIPYYAN